jgi:short-subunit dehydrogenase
MKREISGQRILITGASVGIGRALAVQLARAGAKLVLAARSDDKLRALADELVAHGADVLAIPSDVTIEADRAALIAAAKSRFGGLDVLVNNAGVSSWAHFADSSEEVLRTVMEVNFFAPTELIRVAIPLLTRGRQPAVVNVASRCGRRGMPGWSEYSASKFALCGLTEALRGELARFDIDVLLILPGLTSSDFGKNLLLRKGRANIQWDKGMPPEQVAAGIVRSLRNNRTESVMSWEARWVLLCNKFFPRLTDWLLARKMKQLYPNSESPQPAFGAAQKTQP